MTEQRPTIRPVTLPRLFEVTDFFAKLCCQSEVASRLDVTKRRADEIIKAAIRIGLITARETPDGRRFSTTDNGQNLLRSIEGENWPEISHIIQEESEHYHRFLKVVDDIGPAQKNELLTTLKEQAQENWLSFNETSIDVLSDWAERLGVVQRNAFTGEYYIIADSARDQGIIPTVGTVYDDLNATVGVGMSRQSIPIPEFREKLCQQLRCSRKEANRILIDLNEANTVVELQGAPMDTVAKEAPYGVKSIHLDKENGLLSARQATEQDLTGLCLNGRAYYYIAIYGYNSDTELNLPQNDD